jgi:acyl transferase domain-containing protein
VLAGTPTGVFVGAMTHDHLYRFVASEPTSLDAYAATGNTNAFLAGRLAYTLGLEGPALTIETACSSSLVAVHLAAQSLRRRECDVALAGGVNVMLDPMTTRMMTTTQALSPQGRCRAFDARANGYVRSEGCGVVAL